MLFSSLEVGGLYRLCIDGVIRNGTMDWSCTKSSFLVYPSAVMAISRRTFLVSFDVREGLVIFHRGGERQPAPSRF